MGGCCSCDVRADTDAATGRSPVDSSNAMNPWRKPWSAKSRRRGGVVATCRGILAIRNRIHDGSNSTYVVFLMDWVSGEPSPDGIETDRAEWLTLKEIERLENRPAINLVVAEGALSGSARLLSGTEVESGTGDTYKLFVG